MFGKLEFIKDWESRARRAGYDLSKLAVICDVSERRLQQFFRQKWGFSPDLWLRRLRLIDIVHRLPDDCLVKEAAPHFGCATSAVFCDMFRDAFGISPGRFLRQYTTMEARISFLTNFISLSPNFISFKPNLLSLQSVSVNDIR